MKYKNFPFAVLGFCAWSGTGKTTLLTKLIPLLKASSLSVAVVKHAHHNFDIDIPNKDSFRFRQAGAEHIVVSSDKRMAYIHERQSVATLIESLNLLSARKQKVDIVLVEGFKSTDIKKIELHRSNLKQPFFYPTNKEVIAIATDDAKSISNTSVDVLDINNIEQINNYIVKLL